MEPTSLNITNAMASIIDLVSKEAKISHEQAVARIFALADIVYKNTTDSTITISDSTNTTKISKMR